MCTSNENEPNQILLNGDTAQALHQWEEKLNSLQDKPETPQSVAMETVTLLSILYTHLLQYNLGVALLLVQSLIDSWDGESSTNQGPSKLSSYLAVEGGGDFDGQEGLGVLRKAARPVVRTLARFMAAYFSNRQLFVYPPHAARPLPPVHLKVETGPRATPLHHTEVSSAVRRQSLSDVWTADFTMELLLLCGQAPEAVWLASQLGDWKGAFMLAVSYLDYLKTIPATAKLNKSLQLPDSLQPLALLQGRLMSFLSNSLGGADTNSNAPLEGTSHALKRTASTGSLNFDEDSSTDQVCRSLQDLFTVATVAGAEAVPWLLERVVRQMQAVCSRLSTEVPAGLYLPAPPLYLPQPASTSEEYVDPDVRHEKDLRREMAHLTQLALVLLQAASCQLPCARWYLQQLLQARQVYNKKIKKLPSDTLVEMPEGLAALLTTGQDFTTLHGTSQPQGSLSAPSHPQDTLPEPILRVVSSFRRLCGLLWMLEARERLSLCGRKLQTLRERAFNKPLGNNDNEELELCKTALDWALNMLPFADYLDAEDDLQDIVLSLVGELPMTRTTGDILADHFYDPELLSPTVEEKWNHLQTKMRKTRISVDQTTEQKGRVSKESKKQGSKNDGKSAMLSVYFHKKSGKQKKEMEKKARVFGSYETQVFSKTSSNEKVCVGSWPFETDDSYLFFLETFFSVAFGKAKQEEKGDKVPLLAPYKLEVREREVNSMAHKAMLTFQHKSLVVKAAMSFLGEASYKDIESKSLGKKSLSQSLSSVVGGKTEGKRLFKSRSVADVNESETIRTGDVGAEGDDGKSPKRSLSQRRAASLSDLGQQRSPTKSWVSMTDLRPKGGVNLGGKFNDLTPLVEWLHRWSCKKNVMSPSTKDGAFPGGGGAVDSKAVIRVRVPPSLVLTSFWLMENLYFKKQLSSSTLQVSPQEYVVYPAFGGSGLGAQHATTSHESEKREETTTSNVHQDGRQDSKESSEENKGRKGRKQTNVEKQGSHETSSEGMSTDEAGKQARRPRTTNKQQQANKRGKSPVRVHASIPRHVLESPTEISSSSWTPVLSSDSPTEEKVRPPQASMTSVTSMSPQRVEAKKKLSFASQPSTLSPEESIRSEDSSTFNISSLADDESQATPTGQPITIPTPGSHLTRERPVASSTPHSAYGGQRSGEQGQTPFEKNPGRPAQDGTVIHKKGQAGSKGKGRVTSTGAPVPSGSSSLPGVSVPKKGSTVPGSPSSSVEDAVNNVKEMRQLVRSELRSILEVQHQNIVSLLNTSGTVNVVVGNNPGRTQVNTADRHTQQVSQELQVAQLEHIAAQVSPTAPASAQVQNGPQPAAHNQGNPTTQPQMEPSILNTQGRSHPTVPLLRFPGFPDYSQNPGTSAIPQNTRDSSANPRYQNPSTFENPHRYDNMTRPHNPGHNPGYAVPGNNLHPGFAVPESSLHPPGMPLLRLPPEIPFQRPVTVPFQAWGQNSVPAETHDHNAQASQDGGRTGWPSHLNLEQYDAELVNSVNKKGAKKDRGPLLPNNSKSKKSYAKPVTNPTPQEAGAEGMGFPGAPGAFAPAMMPLLHLDNSYAPSQMMGGMYRMPQPQNNYPHFPAFPQPPIIPPPTDIEDVALRLPLLHLRDNPQAPSYQYSFAPGMPRLVPPEEIIAYEQKKHQTEVLKTHRRQKEEEDAAARRQENLPLLQADIEPWDPKGDRENLNRQRRRMQKDSGVSQDAGKVQRKGSYREKEDRKSVTEDEDEPTHDEVPTPGVIVVQPSPGPDRTTQQTATAQDSVMPRDQGYVIPPGTFDEYLEYQTVVPTPAQIHYDAVVNKKAKPIMKTADTQTDKPDKDEGLDAQTVQTEPERERRKPQPTAEKETNTVIVVSRDVYSAEQAVSQYAASGMDVSRGGPGLPPDIFFNIRFGREAAQAANSGAGLAPSQMQDQEVQTPAFLNVVDIDNSLLKDLKPTKQPRQRQRTPPDTGETVEEHRRSPAPGLPDDATPADLHYRLAGLTNSIKPAEVDDEGNIREPPVGDSLTVDLLSSTTGESPVNLAKIRRNTAGVRAKSRERLADKLTEMGRQLDAIDQMANNMEDDFKNTRLLVNTIDNLGEAIHPEEEEAFARRPRGRGQQYDSRHDNSIPPVIDEDEERIERPVREKPLPSPIIEEEEDVDKEDEADRQDRVPIAAPKQADRDLERLLDMTGLSGVSDIIAEVFADGGLREEDLGLSLTGADLTRDSMLPSEPFASTQLSVDTLQDVFSPRAQDTSRQEEDRRAKKRKEVQKWMLEKRTERRSEYLKQLEELRSTEHRPYKPAQDSPKQGATWKQIHQAEKEMEDRRKALLQENMSERVKQAYDLMGDIVIDTPELPASSLPPPSVRKKKPARPGSSARGSSPLRRGLPKSSTPIPRSQRMQDIGFDVDEYDIDDDLIEELLQDSGEVQGEMLKTYKVRDVSKIGEHAQGGRRPKPFTKLVRQQRPEAVRNQPTGKPKTYAEKLGDSDASKIPRPTFNKLKDKQRLYGTMRLPGTAKSREKTSPRLVKTYAQRLQELRRTPGSAYSRPILTTKGDGAAGGGGVSRNRMQEVTRRGLPSEPKPREYASTYARYRANTSPNQRPGTGRRGGSVSPRQPVGKRFEGPRHKSKTYSQQLQDISAAAPKGRPRLAYTGTSSRGLKSPSMRTQTLRHAPYPDVYESVLEDISEASTASLLRSTSDDVRRILDEEDIFGDGGARPRYRDYPDYDAGSLYDVGDDILGDDYINSVDPDQLSQASQSTGSILSNINWDEVEQLIATVE
ncbi:ciliogenesis and planar polarity effector 1-like [Branchiostoma lanceolatum]|uniref:ciliogenesis and planar polarity effector 1-like n=1 Tax=Branchiostoma lanceolatum TaxID=7740 RepID=UPI0034529D09